LPLDMRRAAPPARGQLMWLSDSTALALCPPRKSVGCLATHATASIFYATRRPVAVSLSESQSTSVLTPSPFSILSSHLGLGLVVSFLQVFHSRTVTNLAAL
jgi:hypothetical protein